MKFKLPLLLLTLALAGCNAHKVTYDTTLPRGQVHSEWTGHYLGGLVGHPEVYVRKLCPAGAAKIETFRSVGNGLIGALTLGIYTPRTIRITCAGQTRPAGIAGIDAAGDIQFALLSPSADKKVGL